MNRFLGVHLPFLILVAIAANAILSRFGIDYVYAVLILFGTVAMAVTGISPSLAWNKCVLLAYFLAILAMATVHAVMLCGELMIVSAVLIYLLVPIYWFIYFCKYNRSHLDQVIALSIPVIYLVGLLGLVQFFYSPSLFNLIELKSNSLQWASNSTLDVYITYFRATSTLGSPQVYGLFMALGMVLVHSRSVSGGMFRRWGGLAFLFMCGLLSGNKSFVVVLFIYFLWCMIIAPGEMPRKTLIALVLLIPLSYGLHRGMEYLPILNRLASIEQIMAQEENDSRLAKYLYIVEHTNPLVGNGLGTLTNRSAPGIKAAESYLLKIYYELGGGVLVLFLTTMALAFLNAWRSRLPGVKELIALIFISMIIVHAFDSPAFFLFWGIVISAFSSCYDRLQVASKNERVAPSNQATLGKR